jgi:hypothetical protein
MRVENVMDAPESNKSGVALHTALIAILLSVDYEHSARLQDSRDLRCWRIRPGMQVSYRLMRQTYYGWY